jgi:hypothetical protein
MKKIQLPVFIILAAAMVTSCSREIMNHATGQSTAGNEEMKVMSNWFTLPLHADNKNGVTCLEGILKVKYPEGVDMSRYVKLVYMIKSADGRATLKLPANVSVPEITPDGLYCFRYTLDDRGFVLTIKNPDPSAFIPEAVSRFQQYSFRYILVPASMYSSHKINWENYQEALQLLSH